MTEQQKARLRQIAQWEYTSFPNGSAYEIQVLPHVQHDDVIVDASSIHGNNYLVTFAGCEPMYVSRNCRSVGSGTDLEAHFCSRNQALIALM